MRILMFLHSWGSKRRLLPPYDSFVEAFRELGHHITVVWSNDLMRDTTQWDPGMSEARVIDFIKCLKPELVVSVNNGGMTSRIRNAIGCPVCRWLFDDYPHLFFEDETQDLARVTQKGDKIFCYSSFLRKQIEDRHPELASNLEFLPHAASETPNNVTGDLVNIAFVGTLLDQKKFTDFLKHCNQKDPELGQKLLLALRLFRNDYQRPVQEILEMADLVESIHRESEFGWDGNTIRRTLSDVVSSQDRVIAMRRLSTLGLRIYGNPEWLDSMIFTSAVPESYQFGSVIDRTDLLMNVYHSAKIVVDIPNVQNVNAISNRVMDVMASPALLITKCQEDSDARRLFGGEIPFPMYKDLDHLYGLCEHFLTHEDERAALVKKCNALVRTGHSYRDRALVGCDRIGINPVGASKDGTVTFIRSSHFRRDHGVRRFSKRLVRRVFRKLISCLDSWEQALR